MRFDSSTLDQPAPDRSPVLTVTPRSFIMVNMTTTRTTIADLVELIIDLKATTPELLAMHEQIDTHDADEGARMVRAAIAEVLDKRHDIGARMDVVYGSLSFTGSYTDALRRCLDEIGAL